MWWWDLVIFPASFIDVSPHLETQCNQWHLPGQLDLVGWTNSQWKPNQLPLWNHGDKTLHEDLMLNIEMQRMQFKCAARHASTLFTHPKWQARVYGRSAQQSIFRAVVGAASWLATKKPKWLHGHRWCKSAVPDLEVVQHPNERLISIDLLPPASWAMVMTETQGFLRNERHPPAWSLTKWSSPKIWSRKFMEIQLY